MRFLVVDDSSTMRRIIKNTLDKIGYGEVVEAENGKDALKTLAGGGFDMVITDWNMPVMDGLEFVKQVRAGNFGQVPILMVTTMAAKEDVIQALKAGVNNYVVKPMTPETLKEKVDQVLGI